MGKLSEVKEVRGKLRDECPAFYDKDYCLLTSRTTVGSDNFASRGICNPALKNALTYLVSADLQSAAKEHALASRRICNPALKNVLTYLGSADL